MMLLRQSIAAARLFPHVLAGIVLLVLTGALWNNKSSLVKRTKQWWLGGIVQLLGIDVEVHGEVPQPEPGRGLLYVSNHISWVDIPLIGGLTQLNFLSKAEVRGWPLIGKLAEGTGTLFIQRGSGDAGRVAKAIADYLDEGRSVLFFPEGTTSDGSSVGRFHKRLFQAGQHTAVQMCPIAIHYCVPASGDNPVAFIDDDEFTHHLWRVLRHRKIQARVQFLPLRSLEPTALEHFVAQVQGEVAASVADHHRQAGTNTNTQWPDASTPAAREDGAASF